MEKLVLIDGNSLINRAFYAMPILSTKSGEYTNAVYGFMNMFFKMISDHKPTHVAVAFDLKAPTFRHKMYAEYKGTRKPMPEELRPQIPLLKTVLKEMGVFVVEKEGFEADDIIGTIAKKTDVKTIVITGDKDSFQLVDEQTEIHFTKRGLTDLEIYTLDNFEQKMGITPIQVIELKSLMGDSSDNIPGVKGVGEKTAKTLIQTYGNIQTLYDNTDKLTGKLKEKIVDGKESAFMSHTLATIDINAPVCTDLACMQLKTPFSHQVKKLFTTLEFKTLVKKDDYFLPATSDQVEQADTSENLSLAQQEQKVTVVEITDLEQLKTLKFEDNTTLFVGDNSVNVYFNNTEYVAKIRQTLLDDGFDLSAVLNALKSLFNGDKRVVVYCKKDLAYLLSRGSNLTLTAFCEDVSIIKYLVDFSGKSQTQAEFFLEYDLSFETPAHSLYLTFLDLQSKLIEQDVKSLYYDVELPLSDLLYDMESAGFKVDSEALNVAGENYRTQLEQLESQIRQEFDQPLLNVNSPKQLGDLIFDKLKLAKGKKTKSGYSTSAEVLESIEHTHPAIPKILTYRRIQKLYSTYIEGFKPLIDKSTGLIHTYFNQTMTATGRLSSKEPNLQNIPVRDEEGRELRKFFVPRDEDHILVSADYSQIELRLLASFSNCKSLINAFNGGADIHKATASKVFDTPIDEVTPKMRSNAKAVNFGIVYGISEYGLAKNLKITPAEARRYIDSYFNEYPEVKEYMQKNVLDARELGYSTTLLKRRRYIREINASNYNLRQFGERVAMNMPLQGSSADIIKIAMLNVDKRLKRENLKSKLILQIHDELIIDALVSEKEQVIKLLVEEMENAVNLSVKLTVGVGEGKTWYEAK